MSATDKRKQSLYFPESMLQEIQKEAARLDRSLSWIVQRCVKIGLSDIRKLPSVNDIAGRRGRRPEVMAVSARPAPQPAAGHLVASAAARLASEATRVRALTRGMEYDARGFAAAADGTRLFYGIRGAGPGLVLLDGIGCDGWAWNHIQPHLAPRHRVVHAHYRGHGRSGAPVDPRRDRHRDAERRCRARAGRARGLGAPCCSRTRWARRSRSRCIGARRERVRALVLICGSYGRITHTFHGNDSLHRVLPKLIEKVQQAQGRRARAVGAACRRSSAFRIAGWLGEIDGVVARRREDFRAVRRASLGHRSRSVPDDAAEGRRAQRRGPAAAGARRRRW